MARLLFLLAVSLISGACVVDAAMFRPNPYETAYDDAPRQRRYADRSTDGEHGDICHSSIDCAAGAFCKDRGDGYKICMNDGRRGELCSSSIDCEHGRFCKDRGDGMKVCL
jgi:hypothetical protein